YNDYIYTYGGVPAYGYTQLPFDKNGHMRTLGTFVDDTFRVNQRLTLNLGVRYDWSGADLPGGRLVAREGSGGGRGCVGAVDAVPFDLALAGRGLHLENDVERQERAEGPLRPVLPGRHHR